MRSRTLKRLYNRTAVISLSICLLCITADAQRSTSRSKSAHLKFSNKSTELSGIGLRLKILDNAREAPAPPPNAHLYIKTMGATETKVEMFSPEEVWVLSQVKGRWTDQYDNSMTLATIKLPLPKGFSRKHVEMPQYEAAVINLGGERNKWTEKELREWVADFLSVKSVTSQQVKTPSFKILKLHEFLIPDKSTPVSYAFQLNPKAASVYKPDDTWYFITLDLHPSIRSMSARQTIAGSLLPSISASKKSEAALKGASSKFQSTKVDKGDSSSAEFMASKKRVAGSISNMKNWWYAETKNYIFLSDLGIRHKVFIKGMQEEMESLRAAYVKLMPPQAPISAVSVVRVFSNEAEYETYVGPEFKWSGGLWHSSKKEMIIRSPQGTSSKQNTDIMRRVIYHEGFHQYLYYAMDQIRASAWFNEGHAVFFENGAIKSRYFYAEEDESYLKTITKMISSGSLDISSLIKMDYSAFYNSSKEKRNENYALSWALIYYLRKYAPLEKPASNAGILNTYIKTIVATQDDLKATQEAFKNTNMYNFTRDFKDFWGSKNKRGYAKRNLLFK